MTWSESVALSFGWIDGRRKSIDQFGYKIRFTPRQNASKWSRINLKLAEELIALNVMTPAGLAAYEGRPARTADYSYEQPRTEHTAIRSLKSDERALTFFRAQPPSYRKLMSFWLESAKKPETRARRVARLIAACRAGKRL